MVNNFKLIFKVKTGMLKDRGNLAVNRLAKSFYIAVYLKRVRFYKFLVRSPFKEDLLKSSGNILVTVAVTSVQ
jgi:hypothetical protein